MESLKKKILLLSHEQQAQVHAIIGDKNCVHTGTGVRFNLNKLTPEQIERIQAYIEAINKPLSTPLVLRPSPASLPAQNPLRKKFDLSKHQLLVKKRLKVKCRQRKAAKQDKSSSRIDIAVASEFCDALKTSGDANDDDDIAESTCGEPEFDVYDTAIIPEDGLDDQDEQIVEETSEVIDDEPTSVLPPHIALAPLPLLYEHYHAILRKSGFPC